MRKMIIALFISLEVLILSYIGISFFVATQMAYAQPKAITETAAALRFELSRRELSQPTRSPATARVVHTRGIAQWAIDNRTNDHNGSWIAFQP